MSGKGDDKGSVSSAGNTVIDLFLLYKVKCRHADKFSLGRETILCEKLCLIKPKQISMS